MDLPIKAGGIIYAQLDKTFKFLLLRRTPEDGDFWQPLTEGLKEGETVEECLKRGISEEVGVTSIKSITDRLYSFSWENKHGEPMIDLVYGVEIDADVVITINPEEHSEYRWVTFDEALVLLKHETNKIAFQYFKEKMISGR